MVHIKKLEVYGFKSFGFRNTVVNFEKGLVAVTGPNGSGKSNILDAIMFAIGENSPKALRVDKFQSLFHDSQNSSHRLIRVSLTFENGDRGIPVDSDAVTLTREMEGQSGESQYLLNGKKISKGAITELLEVVLAAPSRLNIVQQGMITRISELNSEERRKIIEDIVGLSYFDEKKAESIKELDEADRRLEVAFARMGEIRKRIDELEAERNDQLRYDQIGSEIKRFRAIQISNSIRTVRKKLESGETTLHGNTQRSTAMSKQLDEMRQEIEKLDAEKSKFIQEVDAANKSKAHISGKISSVVHESERTKAMLLESERRIAEIERRLPTIDNDKETLGPRVKGMYEEAERLRSTVNQKKEHVSDLKTKLDSVDANVERMQSSIAKYEGIRQRLESRLARMLSLKSRMDVAAATVEEKIKTNAYKKSSIDESLSLVRSEGETTNRAISDLSISLHSNRSKLAELTENLAALEDARQTLQLELENSSALFTRAETVATRLEERVTVAKNAMNEDFAIAELMKNREKFGISGLVRDLLKWDAHYERPILAAGSDWMKAFVVDDLKSMILVAAYAKERKLPRLRIISRNLISRRKPRSDIPRDDVNIVGRLSEFVKSDHNDTLAEYLFANTILTRTSSSAYTLSRQGCRAVSAEGELFEPAGESMSLDFGSKISDMTEAILLGDNVENIRELLGALSKRIERKNLELGQILDRMTMIEGERVRTQLAIDDFATRIEREKVSAGKRQSSLEQMELMERELGFEHENFTGELARLHRRISLLGPAIDRLMSRMQGTGDDPFSKSELAARQLERVQIVKSFDNLNIELGQAASTLGGIESRLELESRQLVELDDERQRLTLELEQRKRHAEEMRTKTLTVESELTALRDQEQQIIDSSGGAYSVLQEYERKIKGISESERKLSKEHSIIERESALLRKEVADLTTEESRLTNDLVWLGYKNPLDEIDVAYAIKDLTEEYEQVKSRINLRADESYVQVIDGYRGMSGRRNQLENERNSIVSFIQQIEKEKRDLFMESFQKVDGDIRATFEKMTGGSAWLEIENREEIFSSGVMLLVRFPNKTVPRESTALSGGEKTIAATVFLLALQSLKPSPFYLMDEVDAHLDAPNTERLSKVLLDRSKDNQIIMVTLKDSTVAKAGLIYGVYPREGASLVVKYKNPAQVPLAQLNSGQAK